MFPTDLSTATLVLVALVAALGALGGVAHWAVSREDGEVAWKSGVVGLVAALGALAFATPSTIEQLGQSLLVGFFGRAVLSVLQTRVTSAVEAERKQQAKAVAREALALVHPVPNPAPDPAVVVGLAARLEAIR